MQEEYQQDQAVYPVGIPATTYGEEQQPLGGAFKGQKGEKQDAKCNDAPFAAIFYLQFFTIIVLAFTYGVTAITDDQTKADFEPYVKVAAIIGVFSFLLSGCGLLALLACPSLLIKVSLFFVVGMSLLWAIISFAAGSIVAGCLFLFFFLLGLCYIKVVWDRIPFATANLVTATIAVKTNFGLVFLGYWMTIFGMIYAVFWTMSFMGILQKLCGGYDECKNNFPYGAFFGLVLAYYWTMEVVSNIIHVTVAGTIATWWFTPHEAASCCSPAILGSYLRSLTTSFGSICLGSFIVAFIQALRAMAEAARQNDDGNALLLCLVDCILACLQGIMEYFNKWAYIYVGVYGYSYCEAGSKVMELFRDRGWEAIIADDLVANALALVTIVVGLISGAVGLIVSQTTDWFPNANDEDAICFTIGLLVGWMLCGITMSLVASAVNTVIVLFADAPAEFQRNWPDLSDKMRDAYTTAFPGCCQ